MVTSDMDAGEVATMNIRFHWCRSNTSAMRFSGKSPSNQSQALAESLSYQRGWPHWELSITD